MSYTLNPTGINYAFQPQSQMNQSIQNNANLVSNWKYRQYMQKNANDIMKFNTMQSIQDSGNNPYAISNSLPSEKTPYMYNSIYDNQPPKYGYKNTDLKQSYLTKEQMKSRMIAPTIQINNKY